MGYLISSLLTFLGTQFSLMAVSKALRIAIVLAFTTFFIASVWAYLTAANSLINGISSTVPAVVNGVWGWVMPSNANTCFIAIGSSYLLRFFSNLYFGILNKRLSVIAGGGN